MVPPYIIDFTYILAKLLQLSKNIAVFVSNPSKIYYDMYPSTFIKSAIEQHRYSSHTVDNRYSFESLRTHIQLAHTNDVINHIHSVSALKIHAYTYS